MNIIVSEHDSNRKIECICCGNEYLLDAAIVQFEDMGQSDLICWSCVKEGATGAAERIRQEVRLVQVECERRLQLAANLERNEAQLQSAAEWIVSRELKREQELEQKLEQDRVKHNMIRRNQDLPF